MPPIWLILAVAATCITATSAGSECGLGGVVVKVNSDNSTFLGIPASSNELRRNESETLSLAIANPPDACGLLQSDVSGAAVLLHRGNCSFSEKLANLQQANAAVGLIANTDEDCMFMSVNETQTDPEHQVILVSIPKQAGILLAQSAAAGTTVSVWLPDYSSFDFNVVLLWVVAVGTFTLAGICAANDYKGADAAVNDESRNTNEYHLDILEITATGAMAFVAVASASLLILYFFLDNAFYWVLVTMFSIGALQALAACVSPACKWCFPTQQLQLHSTGCKWLPQRVVGHTLLSNGIALATVAVWLVFRNWAWGWLLQDLLGVCLIVLVLRQYRLPNLKVASILLPLCFVYDVFWVFLQPLLTNGDSVMVKVATGGDQHWQLPMLIIIPAFHATPGVGPVMLGFGDILLPGLLGVYARTHDVYNKLTVQQSYFWPCVAGYGVGLLMTYGALFYSLGGDQGQPALLYLVPCTLGTVLVLAYIRRQLPHMWSSAGVEPGCECDFSDVEANREAEAPLL